MSVISLSFSFFFLIILIWNGLFSCLAIPVNLASTMLLLNLYHLVKIYILFLVSILINFLCLSNHLILKILIIFLTIFTLNSIWIAAIGIFRFLNIRLRLLIPTQLIFLVIISILNYSLRTLRHLILLILRLLLTLICFPLRLIAFVFFYLI